MSTLKAIRKLTPDERETILSCMESRMESWNDSHPLTPEEEDVVADLTILYHTFQQRNVTIDVETPEVAADFPTAGMW